MIFDGKKKSAALDKPALSDGIKSIYIYGTMFFSVSLFQYGFGSGSVSWMKKGLNMAIFFRDSGTGSL
jgi:hypothetical protein